MSAVLEELLVKRKALAAELGALDAGISAYRRALNGAAPQTKPAATVSGTRPDDEFGREEEALATCQSTLGQEAQGRSEEVGLSTE